MKYRRAIVCGSGRCNDLSRDLVWRTLDEMKPELIIEGGFRGVDTVAREWAGHNNIPCATLPANWQSNTKNAGSIRNGWMLQLNPDVVIAFPGGPGTKDMVQQAHEADVEVISCFSEKS